MYANKTSATCRATYQESKHSSFVSAEARMREQQLQRSIRFNLASFGERAEVRLYPGGVAINGCTCLLPTHTRELAAERLERTQSH